MILGVKWCDFCGSLFRSFAFYVFFRIFRVFFCEESDILDRVDWLSLVRVWICIFNIFGKICWFCIVGDLRIFDFKFFEFELRFLNKLEDEIDFVIELNFIFRFFVLLLRRVCLNFDMLLSSKYRYSVGEIYLVEINGKIDFRNKWL